MIVFVRFNQGPCVPVELQEEDCVCDLKEAVGGQQGVEAELLRVLFNGRELHSTATLQSCELPEQSTVHVLHHPSSSSSSSESRNQPELNSSSSSSSSSAATAQEGVCPCSSFFVFCKRCSSIQRGKLRVCCSGCKDTTLTLSREPSCWDDVLIPGRIKGSCQSNTCQSTEAEFYMKCAVHPTAEDDRSVSLNLITANYRNHQCIACSDITDVVLVFSCSDGHVICLDCFHGYCQTRLNDRQFVHQPDIGYTLPCAVGCSDSLIREIHHFRILGDEQYGRYLQYGAEECLLSIGGVLCPSPGCGAGLLPPEGGRRVECERPLGCGFVFCQRCREDFHQGACPTAQAPPTEHPETQGSVGASLRGRGRGRGDAASLRLMEESTKRCPQCSVPTERSGGCMHMQCSRCGADWCWVCGVPWNRDCMGNHWFG